MRLAQPVSTSVFFFFFCETFCLSVHRNSFAKRLEEVKKTAKKLNYLNPDPVREVYRVLERFFV